MESLFDWESLMNKHVVVEVIFALIIVYLLLQKSYTPKKQEKLSSKEKDELIEEWTPEPLVPADEHLPRISDVCLEGGTGPTAQVDGRELVNVSSMDFLGMACDERVKEATVGALNKYGCGSCGPRGFYGTLDVHLQLEEKIATFTSTEEAIVYSYDVATISSVIPAFAKRGDLLLVDKACNFSIQQGVMLSRSIIIYFEHNDMEDLEAKLKSIAAKDAKNPPKKLNRRFIITEGIFMNTGNLTNLKKVVELKEKYRWRLILDESISFGTIGETGKGAVEHFGLSPSDIDILCASMSCAMGTVGGFCAGSRLVVDHQRLSGSGYCFSASLPPFNCAVGITALGVLESEGKLMMSKLRSNISLARTKLKQAVGEFLIIEGDEQSPMLHLRLKSMKGREEEEELVWAISDICRHEGCLVVPARYIKEDFAGKVLRPSLRFSVSHAHTDEHINKAVAAIKTATLKALK
mmetsp:Transcript_10811/g.28373  ORF Transcript_10811/g.28373 Transcript_10811/m.28373 type:complete len:465 (+) Transcript_10811:398-1792(+)|eukprot:CAMPEP_0113882578 /NCGR_PEP_ID=MMETSP0780_2-20120614/9049_1 /TAXON_ID=652834 /ORGANISM="Palpitomonas bilix" /LENGTH=464 /DNA_ID=CAMNT_0000869641 /DNA_START=200 /DNA_END=1597 /DNA_ORIENTATION=- /assembly_acc=CAM_ASM_000599